MASVAFLVFFSLTFCLSIFSRLFMGPYHAQAEANGAHDAKATSLEARCL